jgi:hypothetical protein
MEVLDGEGTGGVNADSRRTRRTRGPRRPRAPVTVFAAWVRAIEAELEPIRQAEGRLWRSQAGVTRHT